MSCTKNDTFMEIERIASNEETPSRLQKPACMQSCAVDKSVCLGAGPGFVPHPGSEYAWVKYRILHQQNKHVLTFCAGLLVTLLVVSRAAIINFTPAVHFVVGCSIGNKDVKPIQRPQLLVAATSSLY